MPGRFLTYRRNAGVSTRISGNSSAEGPSSMRQRRFVRFPPQRPPPTPWAWILSGGDSRSRAPPSATRSCRRREWWTTTSSRASGTAPAEARQRAGHAPGAA